MKAACSMDVSRARLGPQGWGEAQGSGLGAQTLPFLISLFLCHSGPLQNGEILPLKADIRGPRVTTTALLLTFLFLAVTRTLRSNQHGISGT